MDQTKSASSTVEQDNRNNPENTLHNSIIKNVGDGFQTAHQATIYHQFFFNYRYLIESIAPLFIGHIIHLHPFAAFFTVGSAALCMIILIRRFASRRSATFCENLKKLTWLKKHTNKKIILDHAEKKQLNDCIKNEKSPIQNYQKFYVLGIINFTLNYLAILQVSQFITKNILTNLYKISPVLPFLSAILSLTLEKYRALTRTQQSKEKTRLCEEIVSLEKQSMLKKSSSYKKIIKKNSKHTNIYKHRHTVAVYALITLNIFVLQPTLALSTIIPILITISYPTYLIVKYLAQSESLRLIFQSYITTFTAAQALMQLGKLGASNLLPSIIINTAPSLTSTLCQSTVVLYTCILYLYHLIVSRDYKDTLCIQKTLNHKITPADELFFHRAMTKHKQFKPSHRDYTSESIRNHLS